MARTNSRQSQPIFNCLLPSGTGSPWIVALLLALGTVLPTEIIRAEGESPSAKEPVPATPENLDQGLIWAHVSRAMDADDNPNKVFVRWEKPVRYYLQGLEGHPRLERLFNKQIAKISRITGLEIKRHPDVYLPYKDPDKRETGPRGYSTNAAFFFSKNMKNGFQEPLVQEIILGFGDKPEKNYEKWKEVKNKAEKNRKLIYQKYGFSREGIAFFLFLGKKRGYWTKSNSNKKVNKVFLLSAINMVKKNKGNANIIKSILNSNSKKTYQLTTFDKAFLQVYYSELVHSGMGNREAALKITEALTTRFKKKAGDE